MELYDHGYWGVSLQDLLHEIKKNWLKKNLQKTTREYILSKSILKMYTILVTYHCEIF